MTARHKSTSLGKLSQEMHLMAWMAVTLYGWAFSFLRSSSIPHVSNMNSRGFWGGREACLCSAWPPNAASGKCGKQSAPCTAPSEPRGREAGSVSTSWAQWYSGAPWCRGSELLLPILHPLSVNFFMARRAPSGSVLWEV